MNLHNYTRVSFDQIKNFKKKTFIISKLKKNSLFPNLRQKTNLLFYNPESYLKLPNETDFNFVIGKKPNGPRYNSQHKLIPYSFVGTYVIKDQKKITKKKTVVPTNSNSSKLIRKAQTFKKMIISPFMVKEEKIIKEDKKKKNTYRNNLSITEIFDIFNKSKKRIEKNKSENEINNKKIYKEIPLLMHQYINEPLTQQENALKNNEKYNNILKKIENNIFKTFRNKYNSCKNKNKNKKNNNNLKFVNSNVFNSTNLMKNSTTEYRIKIEKIKLNDRTKSPNFALNNHVQNWEMSLRRPKNFVGERREYLNVRTDKNPYWVILTEKNPVENEKIMTPHINNKDRKEYFKNFYNTSYDTKFMKPSDLANNENISCEKNNLEIKGKNLLDLEEKLAYQMQGNIKLVDLKYDKESVKDILFKKDYCINNHSFKNKSNNKENDSDYIFEKIFDKN